MELFTERHTAKISGELSCLDRGVISGATPGICYAEGMSSYLHVKGVRIFDDARWAEPLRDRIRQNAQALAEQAGLAGGPADGRPAQASVVAPQVGPLRAAVLSTGGAFGQRLYLWKPKTKNRGRKKSVSRFSVFAISAGEFLCFFFLSCFCRLLLTFSEFCFGLCGQILKRFNRTDHNGLC